MMKLTVGMGSIEDYPEYVEAGADEVFCGFVPTSWMEKFGFSEPLNRREVLYFNVQLGSLSEMEILADMKQELAERFGRQVPATITLNSPFYKTESLEEIRKVVSSLSALGFMDYIVADPKLLQALSSLACQQQEHLQTSRPLRIHLSGEYGQANLPALQTALKIAGDMSLARIIYPRQTSVEDMRQIQQTLSGKNGRENMEYEAFALNERCQFTGAYCNTYHCDELAHICQLPYELVGERRMGDTSDMSGSSGNPVGMSGCGLCELFKLRDAGVTHLKLVSRGNFKEDTIRDIRAVKTALQILEVCESDAEYRQRMQQELFPEGCSGNCYYAGRS